MFVKVLGQNRFDKEQGNILFFYHEQDQELTNLHESH